MVTSAQPGPMSLALDQARQALGRGDLPIGAALEVSGQVVALAHNRIISGKSLLAHAEHSLLVSNSGLLFSAPPQSAVIYTTLEPCLMCLSAAVHARVKKIVYACRDPHGGSTALPPPQGWYESNWPLLEYDASHAREFIELIIQFSSTRPIWAKRYSDLINSEI